MSEYDGYALKWQWTRPRPATRWEPADGGLESLAWFRDGQPVHEADVPESVADWLLEDAHEQTSETRLWG